MFEKYLILLRGKLENIDYIALGLECGVLLLAIVVAVLVYRRFKKMSSNAVENLSTRAFKYVGLRATQRVLVPFVMLAVVFVGRMAIEALDYKIVLLRVATPLLLSFAAIRLTVYILRKALPGSAVKAWENLISLSIWMIVALHLLGWLPSVVQQLKSVGFTLGEINITLFGMIEFFAALIVLVVLASWLSRMAERALQRSHNISAGVKVALSKISKFGLITLAVLIALNMVGINLGALAVFGGALGVGLGFGLQRIASNFISGFILVFDRSIRPGDVISINDKFGWVQELRARYLVVRDRDGVETLIPNENLITTEVVNWSYSDKMVRLKLPVQISYQDDPEQALGLLLASAQSAERTMQDPAPAARLIGFGENGIDLELRIWIRDPQNGVANVRSDINLAIWKAFKHAGITIPYPQQDLYVKELPSRFNQAINLD